MTSQNQIKQWLTEKLTAEIAFVELRQQYCWIKGLDDEEVVNYAATVRETEWPYIVGLVERKLKRDQKEFYFIEICKLLGLPTPVPLGDAFWKIELPFLLVNADWPTRAECLKVVLYEPYLREAS